MIKNGRKDMETVSYSAWRNEYGVQSNGDVATLGLWALEQFIKLELMIKNLSEDQVDKLPDLATERPFFSIIRDDFGQYRMRFECEGVVMTGPARSGNGYVEDDIHTARVILNGVTSVLDNTEGDGYVMCPHCGDIDNQPISAPCRLCGNIRAPKK